MEDGEIIPYDPALEWPGPDGDHDSPSQSQPSNHTKLPRTFRLVVQHTSILPKSQEIAVVDGYSELQFGRDVAPPRSKTPRLRLKEMEVSKLHATVYWDKARSEWTLIDMGSKHGTFHTTKDDGSFMTGSRGSRLSPPRVASMPRRLHHLDRFTIGSTTFIVHLHEDGLQCEACTFKDGEEIPLFDVRMKQKEDESRKRKRDNMEAGPWVNSEKDPKKALILLKRSLLSRHGPSSMDAPDSSESHNTWVDRSARRRALHPFGHELVPSIRSTTVPLPEFSHPSPLPVLVPVTPPPIVSTNVGYKLLEKQGWTPGTSLGQTAKGELSTHRVEPIAATANMGRTGLGLVSLDIPPQTSTNWKEDGKRRRWLDLQP